MNDRTLDVLSRLDFATRTLLSNEEWKRVDEILDAVLECKPEDRPAYLDAACVGETTIREQVEMLMAACEQAADSSFLQPISNGVEGGNMLRAMAEDLPREQLTPGQRVGNYTIVRPIGRGGMGAVYLAERPFGQFNKPVALKVVKRGMDTDDIVNRFRFERQILARLEHANIARLLDGGVTDEGLPYFVMEYVSGEPIDRYCDQRNLTIKERLKLFKTVCEAVQYAHRNLVVHRDLKPGNVLVTTEGEVKLLDFGIAKVLDPTARGDTMPLTDARSRHMTPQYAAPEQVRGEPVTTATDVYALGVILYELISGRRPYRFDSRLLSEIEEKICQEVPGRPSTVATRNLPDAPMKADEVSRRRSTQPDRLRKLLSGDLDAITLKALKKEPELRYASAGDMATDINRYLILRPVHAQRDSVRYRVSKFVRRYKFTVAAAAIAVMAMVGGMVTTTWWWREANIALEQANQEKQAQVETTEFMTAMFSGVNLNTTEEYDLARKIMNQGVSKLYQLNRRPLIQTKVMNALGQVSRDFRLFGLADSLHRNALAIQDEQAVSKDAQEYIESYNGLGRNYLAQYDLKQAEIVFREAVALNPELTTSYNNLGVAILFQGRFQEAIEQFYEVIERDPDNIKATNNLGIAYSYMKDWEQAKAWYERALELEPSYVVLTNLASLYYYNDGRYEDAARLYEDALRLNDKDYVIWGNLAAAYHWIPGKEKQATENYLKAITKAEKKLEEVDSSDPEIISQIATYYTMTGRPADGIANVLEAISIEPDNNKVLMRAAYIYEHLERHDEALLWLTEAIANGYPIMNIEGEPGFAELRKDSRYRALLENGPKKTD